MDPNNNDAGFSQTEFASMDYQDHAFSPGQLAEFSPALEPLDYSTRKRQAHERAAELVDARRNVALNYFKRELSVVEEAPGQQSRESQIKYVLPWRNYFCASLFYVCPFSL
jgi:hypothetical protein